jgi:hypothetical protein
VGRLDGTPDDSRLIALGPGTSLFAAPTAAGEWLELSNDAFYQRYSFLPLGFSISPDSRIVAAGSVSLGVVESIDGGQARAVDHAGSKLYPAPPIFEPSGGRGKALFFETDPGASAYRPAIANADGSGDWIRLRQGIVWCGWASHTALCWSNNDGAYDFFGATDDGKQSGTIEPVAGAWVLRTVHEPTLYYLRKGGGLYAATIPQPAP